MKNTITVGKNRKITNEKSPPHTLTLNLDEPLTLPAGKHYFGLWVKENKETKERFFSGTIQKKEVKADHWQEKAEKPTQKEDDDLDCDIPF